MMMPGGASLPGLRMAGLVMPGGADACRAYVWLARCFVGPVSVAPPGNKGINEGRLLLPAFKDQFTFP
ncbi:hypothetical protein SAMN05444841_103354 [Enterobacter kobei]|nr:hypothetical protein SAMN05444841_103354 [Enterobacter kobei]